MKRMIAWLLVLLLCFGLIGCSETKVGEPEETETETEAVTEPPETEALNTEDMTAEEIAVRTRSSFSEEGLTVDDARLDEVVAACGDFELTNRLLQFYYRMDYMNFLSTYGSYAEMFGLDVNQPLDQQQSLMEGMTWEQFFLCSALESFHQDAAVAMTAKADGYELSAESEAYLLELPSSLETEATSNGYDSALLYVQDAFGPAVTVEDYVEYARFYSYVTSYENEVYRDLRFTDEEIEAYYDANEESFVSSGVTKDDSQQSIDVRHILITPEDADGDGTSTDEEWNAAQARAQELLDEYLDNPSETRFAAMANEYSADPGSNQNGGLYEMVIPGQMVVPFNDWCFDEDRLVGDTGIVQTTYGFHIMYFVGRNAMPYWKLYTLANGLRTERMRELLSELNDGCTVSIDAERIVLAAISAAG